MNKPGRFAAILLALAPAAMLAQGASDAQLDARARAIHDKVLEARCPHRRAPASTPKRYWQQDGKSFTDVDKLDRGGINALALRHRRRAGPSHTRRCRKTRNEAHEKLAAIRTFVKEHPDRLELALSAADIERIQPRKIAIIESFLNARSLGKDLGGIDQLYRSRLTVCSGSTMLATTTSPIRPARAAGPSKNTIGCRRSASRPLPGSTPSASSSTCRS